MKSSPIGKRRRLYWHLCALAVLVLCIISLSPLVIPAGKIAPLVRGLPRALWAGIVIYWAVVVLTIIAARIHPDNGCDEGDTR